MKHIAITWMHCIYSYGSIYAYKSVFYKRHTSLVRIFTVEEQNVL